MNIFRRIARALKGGSPYDVTPHVLDHVPVGGPGDWRRERLAEAARKHGKPFKCAGDDLPREVLVSGQQVVALEREGRPTPPEKVTQLSKRRRSDENRL